MSGNDNVSERESRMEELRPDCRVCNCCKCGILLVNSIDFRQLTHCAKVVRNVFPKGTVSGRTSGGRPLCGACNAAVNYTIIKPKKRY